MGEFVAGLDYPMFVVTAADAGTGERTGDEVDKFTRCAGTSGPQGTPLPSHRCRRPAGKCRP
ncbi:MAG: hypothetical protein E6F99_08260 [Actinobacteria bacterium]|nr:MAG: hypothetical protein E6F99_08260 [Actinomycetota bacterium]